MRIFSPLRIFVVNDKRVKTFHTRFARNTLSFSRVEKPQKARNCRSTSIHWQKQENCRRCYRVPPTDVDAMTVSGWKRRPFLVVDRFSIRMIFSASIRFSRKNLLKHRCVQRRYKTDVLGYRMVVFTGSANRVLHTVQPTNDQKFSKRSIVPRG